MSTFKGPLCNMLKGSTGIKSNKNTYVLVKKIENKEMLCFLFANYKYLYLQGVHLQGGAYIVPPSTVAQNVDLDLMILP